LKDIKTLLVTYDYLKPASSELNTALAEWCKAGGTLIFVGGTDTYNRVKESWWKKAGYGSPGKHLLEQLGFQVGDPNVHEYTDIILHRDDPAKKLGKSPETVTISRAYPVTIYTPPAGATILYHVVFDKKNDTTHQPAIWQTSVGKGNLIVIGIAPGFFSTLPDAVQILVSLVSTGYKKAGEKYKEKGYFKVERGPYVAVHGFDEDNKLHGQYISLFDPNLELKTDPTVYPGETALYAKVDLQGKTPRLLHASGRIYARFETASNTSFFVKAPLKSRGVARLWAGKHKIQEVKAYNVLGRPVYNRYEIKNQTIYVQYENDPDGVVVMVTWKS
jgi:hypothetical protein